MTRFNPHLEVLPGAQRALWSLLGPVRDRGFVLYGGTAVALYLGHRTSVDFDFFSDQPFVPGELRGTLDFLRAAELLHSAPSTLTVSLVPPGESSPVKLSLFGGLEIGRVGDPLQSADGVAWVASLEDLMATKLKVLHDRIESRDYLDLAAMLWHGVPLARGLAAARALYGSAFEPMIALRAVTWFEGGDLPMLLEEVRVTLRSAAAAVGSPLPSVARRSMRLTLAPADGQ